MAHEDSQIITSEDLHYGHALSLTQQPLLKELLEKASDPNTQITLVVGAGASLDSGFLNWDSFIERLAALAPTAEMQRMLLQDTAAGPLRRADTALGLAKSFSPGTSAAIVRRELYEAVERPTIPGETALAIAQVRNNAESRARIITTNFDDVLEEALKIEIPECSVYSFSLGKKRSEKNTEGEGHRRQAGIERWLEFEETASQCSVLHIHGMLPRNEKAKKPLVLSERQFLRYGGRVQKVIAQCLSDGIVVFVGVSLQDPNLVLPLWKSARSDVKTHSFVLSVPVLSPDARKEGISLEQARAYEREKAVLLNQSLGIKPILLKSYSQLHQALRELAIAAGCNDDAAADITGADRYGIRFEKILKNAHQLASDHGPDAPRLLRAGLDPETPLWQLLYDPPAKIKRAHHKLVKALGTPMVAEFEERFALFVWLRTEGDRYALDLVASSVYQYLDNWAQPVGIEIEPTSRYIAAESAFSGRSASRNFPESESVHQWRGMHAVPIRVEDINGNSMSIGIVTLNTNYHVLPEVAHEEEAETFVSVLAAYSDKREIEDQMVEAALRLFTAPSVRTPISSESVSPCASTAT